MAAGLGFKDFVTGEVLTAADVDGYLMQGIWVFASTAARDAAVTSPQEGNFAFTKDTNGLWYYDGAAWVASGATGDIEGVTAGIGISGGGTSGTVTVTNSMATAIDAKGDLVVGTGADTFAKLTVGANGTILTADSAEATGLKWAAAAGGGGMTLLSTTALTSGSTVTISSISQSYKHLYILARAINTSGGADMKMRLNGDTGSNYQGMWIRNETGTVLGFSSGSQTFLEVEGGTSSSTGYTTLSGFEFVIPRYTETEYKQFYINSYQGITSVPGMYFRFNNWNNTAAITSLTFLISSGTYTAGNIFVYGVS